MFVPHTGGCALAPETRKRHAIIATTIIITSLAIVLWPPPESPTFRAARRRPKRGRARTYRRCGGEKRSFLLQKRYLLLENLTGEAATRPPRPSACPAMRAARSLKRGGKRRKKKKYHHRISILTYFLLRIFGSGMYAKIIKTTN